VLLSIAAQKNMPLAALIAEIDAERPRDANLSSALRVHVLRWVQAGGKTG
jgi:predicted DNA-binding ribbon-helix-helix protein